MSTQTLDRPALSAAPGAADVPSAAPPRAPLPVLDIRRVLLSFRREAIWVAIFGFFSNVLTLAPTIYMMQVFDRVMASGSQYTLAALSLITLFFFLVLGLAEWLRSRLLVRAGTRFDLVAQEPVFRASFDAALRNSEAGKGRALADLTQLRQFLTGNAVFAAIDTPWTFIYAGVLYLIHPSLGVTAAIFVVLMVTMALVGNRRATPLHKKAQESLGLSNNYLHGKLRNTDAVEAMGMLQALERRWLVIHDTHLADQRRAQEATHRLSALTKFVQHAQQSIVLAQGAVLAIFGYISPGAMIVCNSLMGGALRPTGLIVAAWSTFVETRGAYQRLNALLQAHPARSGRADVATLRGQISVRGLSATAPGRKLPILQDITLDFEPGEVVGIIGPSGAGKSTLARCLLGVWPDTQGQVLLDGTPIQDWSREAIGPLLGYLPQDIEVFDGSIAENIARLEPDAGDEVIKAAKRTGIHDLVLRLPGGYDTPMGVAGAALSGGQRQRVALARAIFGDPLVVVLDEPNANLDDAGEAALLQAVAELKARGATVFMIVHQPQMLRVADRLLVLENGRVARFGKLRFEAAAPKETPSS
ncbi:MAG TPA: type I secretion system permease/ATPase [Rubrivivax sp.]|nr:type I secretion system permease/ATPase [Burkholderiales bacterium]HNU10604.1 type I secretion system permease/ATPase [Rubrivivax sp.]